MYSAFVIRPVDTLMFRDGRPFNQNDEGASGAESLFPPPLPTLVGAIRAGIWKQIGGAFPTGVLGNGVDWQSDETKLEPLSFGPVLLGNAGDLLFPAPAHLGRDGGGNPVLLTVPESAAFESDLGGQVVYPTEPKGVTGFKTAEDDWVTVAGMGAILTGHTPGKGDVIKAKDLFERETKVGIGIDHTDRIVNDSQLYTASFLRLKQDVEFVLPCAGIPDDTPPFSQRLGGEQRHAQFRLNAFSWSPELVRERPSNKRYIAVTTSATFLKDEPQPGSSFPELPGVIKTAAIPKPVTLGGWDSRSRGPLPMRPIVPAGAVFFMECEDGQTPPKGPVQIGGAQKWGFGYCLIGTWPTAGGNTT